MSKITKFFNKPGIFIRDFFIKKYPLSFDEQGNNIFDESILINNDLRIYNVEVNQSTENVDAVITWVNDKDSNWINKLNYYKKHQIKSINPLSIDDARFENHGELFYVIKSIELHMPWIRTIFLITDDQTPEFPLSNKVIIIDHRQIINEKYLPTFNSHVIEAHLHNIPNLSENFIYFNDDVFVARNLPKSHFLSGNNLSSLFLNKKNLDEMVKKGVKTPTLSASLNCQELLLRKYNKKIINPLIHTYVPLKKSYYNLAWSLFNKEINGFINNRFRDDNDLNLATFLVPWMMFLEGKSKLSRDICYYFNIRSTSSLSHYHMLYTRKNVNILPHSFCANDFSSDIQHQLSHKDNLILFLEKFYS